MRPNRQGARNVDVRPMGEHLTPAQVEQVAIAAGKVGRCRFRDTWLIRIAFRHGLRASELIRLKWDQIDFKNGDLMVRRLKKGKDSRHPLGGDETRALHRLRKMFPDSPYVFPSQLGGPLTPSALQKMVRRAGEKAGLPMPIHPHMLRHACGFKMASEGRDLRVMMDYLGHRTVAQTVRYTEIDSSRFKELFKD